MNGAILVRMEELDRVLNGNDVVRVFLVDLTDDGSQGRRLARTGGAGDEHNASAQIHHIRQLLREVEGFKTWDGAGNYAHYDCATAALHEDVDPETSATRQPVGDIAFALLSQSGKSVLVLSNQVGGDVLGVIGRESRKPRDKHRDETPVAFNQWGPTR
jgi:hypothetical protein